MKTLYVDVYFLINFTIDLLALYFASIFCKISIAIHRLIFSSLLGAAYAVAGAVFVIAAPKIHLLSATVLLLMIIIVSNKISVYRKLKYTVAFLLFEILIGGLVYYGYCLLDRLFENAEHIKPGSENRNLLILSLIVLLSIGVLKLTVSFLGSVRSEKNVKLIISCFNKEYVFEGLVDSGNLAVDPMDKTPVMLINGKLCKRMFGFEDLNIDGLSSYRMDFGKRLRIIPVSFGGNKKILYGIKPDYAYAVIGKKNEEIKVVIAVNSEEDNFGGYDALIPLAALEDIFYGNH